MRFIILFMLLLAFFGAFFTYYSAYAHEYAHKEINRLHGVDSEIQMFCGAYDFPQNLFFACTLTNWTQFRGLPVDVQWELMSLHAQNEIEAYNHSLDIIFYSVVTAFLMAAALKIDR